MVLGGLHSRLLRLQIARATGAPTLESDAAALERDAKARGLGLIVRRVQALLL